LSAISRDYRLQEAFLKAHIQKYQKKQQQTLSSVSTLKKIAMVGNEGLNEVSTYSNFLKVLFLD